MNSMKRFLCLVCCFCCLSVMVYGNKKTPSFYLAELKCENLVDPLGIDNVAPHFSWKLKGMVGKVDKFIMKFKWLRTVFYWCRIKADLWNTGKLKSDASVMVPYQGKTLTSRSLCYWRVRVWDSKNKCHHGVLSLVLELAFWISCRCRVII